MKSKMIISLISMFIATSTYGQQCVEFLDHQKNSEKVISSIEQVRESRIKSASFIVASGVSSQSLAVLSHYFDLVDPSLSVQTISNKVIYLIPFVEDRRLNALPQRVKDKMLQLIESKLFRPLEAMVVAKYVTGHDQSNNADFVAAELVKLRIDELVLMNIKKQMEKDVAEINPRMKISGEELEQISRYLRSDSRLILSGLPKNFMEINSYLRRLDKGPFVSSFLKRYLERIYSHFPS